MPISSLALPLILSFLLSFSHAQPSFRPHALVLPVRKDASTLQYLTTINQRTPQVSLNLVVHLGGRFLWQDCNNSYVSSTYRVVHCRTAQCALARSTSCGDCSTGPMPCNNACGVSITNPFISVGTTGDQAEDVISIRSTDGSNPGRQVTVPRFIFSCTSAFLLRGLASGAAGIIGLGRERTEAPSQFTSAFSFRRRFAICLSPSTSANGVIFLGDGPYNFLPGIDASQSLSYTPLLLNPVDTAPVYSTDPSSEYFINVNAIRINNNPVEINTTLLTIDAQGNGGTKISTVNPYTLMETSLYVYMSSAFILEADLRNISMVDPIRPFDVCFSSRNVGSTRVGPGVPNIEFVLQGQNTVWTITGSNSMVRFGDVLCLGFLDGGYFPRTSIVIGAKQIEDNLLQFDLAASRLGFSSTLLGRQTSCANFNFTSSV